jgi:hypothetical protein
MSHWQSTSENCPRTLKEYAEEGRDRCQREKDTGNVGNHVLLKVSGTYKRKRRTRRCTWEEQTVEDRDYLIAYQNFAAAT